MHSIPFMAAPGNHDTETRDLDKHPDALAYYLYWAQPLNGPLGTEGGPFLPSLKASESNRRAFTEAAGESYPRRTNFSYNYQRSFPLRFVPDKQGTLLVAGKENKTVRGRAVNGRWQLDKSFDGRTDTTPDGVIYLVTGAGGQKLYNPEQNDDPDSWQKFTDKFISKVHSLTVVDVDGKALTIRQIAPDGQELDRFMITK